MAKDAICSVALNLARRQNGLTTRPSKLVVRHDGVSKNLGPSPEAWDYWEHEVEVRRNRVARLERKRSKQQPELAPKDQRTLETRRAELEEARRKMRQQVQDLVPAEGRNAFAESVRTQIQQYRKDVTWRGKVPSVDDILQVLGWI